MTTPLPEGRKAYSPAEVQAFLGIGKNLMYDLLAQKKIRHVKAGRRVLIPAKSLDAYLDGE